MSKKFAELPDEERKREKRVIRHSVAMLGTERYDDVVLERYEGIAKYGLCKDCEHIRYAKSEFTVRAAYCYDMRFRLADNDPITECKSFSQVGQMDLHDMKQIAWLVEGKTRVCGF